MQSIHWGRLFGYFILVDASPPRPPVSGLNQQTSRSMWCRVTLSLVHQRCRNAAYHLKRRVPAAATTCTSHGLPDAHVLVIIYGRSQEVPVAVMGPITLVARRRSGGMIRRCGGVPTGCAAAQHALQSDITLCSAHQSLQSHLVQLYLTHAAILQKLLQIRLLLCFAICGQQEDVALLCSGLQASAAQQ